MSQLPTVCLADTHCHLDFSDFDGDREAIIELSRKRGIQFMVNVGSSLESSRASLALAGKFEYVYPAVGIHPHEADAPGENASLEIAQMARDPRVVAVGEIGLDYFKNFSRQENQRELFASLLKVAKDRNLPVILHSRQAECDMLRMVKEVLPLKAVVHCFSGGDDFLKSCLDLGLFVSFTCTVTYKKSQVLREVVKLAPLERIFLETDAPYLPPEGLRGKRNEPYNVTFVAEEIARIKGMSFEEVARVTTENARKFFNIPS